MFAVIISESTLEQMVCTSCNQYLSHGTTKLANLKRIVCSRCDQSGLTQVLPTNEQFEDYLFPCINRFDNCNVLLLRSQVAEHERTCKTEARHICGKCTYSGNGSQLYHHYLREHKELVLKVTRIERDIRSLDQEIYIYRKDNNLFKIQTTNSNGLKLKLWALGLTANRFTPRVDIDFRCGSNRFFNYPQTFTTNPINIGIQSNFIDDKVICDLNFTTTGDLFTIALPKPEDNSSQIIAALKKSLFSHIACVNCGATSLPPIKRCPSGHVKCAECPTHFCNTCQQVTDWSRAQDLEVFDKLIPFQCRFCEQLHVGTELRAHERNCDSRRYNCVEKYCDWRGPLEQLLNHGHSSSSIDVHKNSFKLFGYEEHVMEAFILHDREIFYARADAMSANGRSFHVRKISGVTSSEEYEGELSLTACGCQKSKRTVSRTFHLKLGSIVDFPKAVFDSLENRKNYEITITIKKFGSSSAEKAIVRRRFFPKIIKSKVPNAS